MPTQSLEIDAADPVLLAVVKTESHFSAPLCLALRQDDAVAARSVRAAC